MVFESALELMSETKATARRFGFCDICLGFRVQGLGFLALLELSGFLYKVFLGFLGFCFRVARVKGVAGPKPPPIFQKPLN